MSKNHQYIIIFFSLISIILSCTPEDKSKNNHNPKPTPNIELATESSNSPPIKEIRQVTAKEFSYVSSFDDKISETEKSRLIEIILDSILVHEYFDYEDLIFDERSEEFSQIYQLGGSDFLVVITYDNLYGPNGKCSEITIINTEAYQIKLRDRINGGRYFAPEISWVDIDNDGKNEILSKLNFPSWPETINHLIESIYEIRPDMSQLVEAYNIFTKSIDCESSSSEGNRYPDNIGKEIQRNYNFESPTKLRVIEKSYSFDCSEYSDSIKTSMKFLKKEEFYFERINSYEAFAKK